MLGEVDDAVAIALARLGRRGARGVAVLLRTTDWATLPAHRASELDDERAHAAAVLASGGWSVAEAAAHETVAAVWARATGTEPAARQQVARLIEPGAR